MLRLEFEIHVHALSALALLRLRRGIKPFGFHPQPHAADLHLRSASAALRGEHRSHPLQIGNFHSVADVGALERRPRRLLRFQHLL